MNNIQTNILKQIKAGEVAMRPRWHFVLRTTLTILGALMVGALLVYVASFIFFVLRLSGAVFVPGFGASGVFALLLSVPWLLVALAVLFLIVLEILVQRFEWSYQKPLVYSVVGVVLLTFIGSYVILQTSLHEDLRQRADHDQAPLIGDLYRTYGAKQHRDITVGVVESFAETSLTVVDRSGEEWFVSISADTKLPPVELLQVGEVVVVLGEREEGIIEARGIRGGPEDIRPTRKPDRERSDPEFERPVRTER